MVCVCSGLLQAWSQPWTESRGPPLLWRGPCACPCPQACEVPAPDADPLHDEPATRIEIALMCIAIVAVAAVLLFAIKACAIA